MVQSGLRFKVKIEREALNPEHPRQLNLKHTALNSQHWSLNAADNWTLNVQPWTHSIKPWMPQAIEPWTHSIEPWTESNWTLIIKYNPMTLRTQPIGKLYYRIGEVADMFKVNTSLIRFYEKEFDIIKPHRNKKGNRQCHKKTGQGQRCFGSYGPFWGNTFEHFSLLHERREGWRTPCFPGA